ncbi:PAS domain-containing sensor histidine kinase [Methylobacterium sp. GC_Met_2]|uniref:hybrid sensor histidine kinase/response regulator n=1 Tax=Methylobacterium sp. GC_Met_2 TaxID=2937376 RepID=UPI00226B12E1|nr:PAS domain-containing sensor histidine kinase [Methylobacterium sp. GC_Met_2]
MDVSEVPRRDLAFLAGGSEMGERMRAHDWAATPLGPLETWPQSLRSMLSVCLNSPMLGTILWGPDLRMLYNDAYIPSMADRHPAALGRPVAEVWGSAWEQVSAPFHRCMHTGEGFSQVCVELPMVRRGRLETTYWDFTAAPIRGEGGTIVGLLNQGTEVTEQVHAERRMAGEAERQRMVFQQMPGFVGILTGPDHVYAYVNDAYVTIAGPRAFVGRGVREVFPELVGQGFYELLDRVYATGEAFSAQSMPIRLAGEDRERFIDLLYRPIRDEDGSVTGIFVGGYDTTERVRAEQALRESEEFNRRVLASSRDCIKVLDLDGNLTFMNEGGYEVMEVSDFNLIRGCPWPSFWEGQGNTEATAAIAAAKLGQSRQFQGPANTMAGRPRWWDVQVSPILDPEGRPDKILSVSRDITTIRQAEDALRGLNETLEQRVEERTRERDQVWRHSRDLQAVVGTDGTFLAANAAWTNILGWAVDEVVGRNHLAFNHPDHHPNSTRALASSSTGELPAYETRCLHKDGTYRWISWVAAPEGGLIYASGRNVTAEKEQALALQAAEEALRQAQKMEAVGQLTGGLAHDFNNLLAGISGSLELMQTRMSQGRFNDVDRYMAAAQGAAKRAASLTHRLLAFSRRQTLDPKPTNVNRLISGMEELIRRTVGPSIHLETVGAAGLWTTLVDPPQLENALLNLCINARDAMPEGGRITIETANRWLDRWAAQKHGIPEGQYLSLCVTDTGTGMPPDVVARVFEPFFTTKPLGEGTGLGLSMIYGFAQQSGGQVRIYSEVGQGTTVCIYLPRHHGDGEAHEEAERTSDLPRSEQGETVLVVDDEPTVRMLVTDILEELGYTAIEAADSVTGLKVLQSDVRIDLLVTDVGLPGGMNGRQMADAARVNRPKLKVLFITGYAENSVLGNGHLNPGMQVLTKPFAVDTMAARIREMIAS